ncbi:GNAT family N-acetyltransferase [Hyphococcus sp.]|uniref:GNAT family N-acetyltransferase n=1 Tax=Hyphococcus sp. TaxID=2038636 RepID=UPI0035C77EAB
MHTIRAATLSDADTLADLWASTFRDAYHHLHTPEDIDAYCAANYTREAAEKVLSSDEYDCSLAFSDNKPSGLLVINWTPSPHDPDGASAELKQIYISASVYGTGLGKALFKYALETLANRDIVWMWLAVSDKNPRAKAFYEKTGFDYQGAGPDLHVGKDVLTSSILARKVKAAS